MRRCADCRPAPPPLPQPVAAPEPQYAPPAPVSPSPYSPLQATVAAPARKRRKMDPLTPPPPASEFPPFEPRDFFRFEVVHRWATTAHRLQTSARPARVRFCLEFTLTGF